MPDERISDLLRDRKKPLLSYEFFPPKDAKGMDLLRKEAENLFTTNPDFVTCTYGAGGSTREKTFEVCDMLKEMGFGPIMPHLTCVGSSKKELEDIADEIFDRGFRNIMSLRGDPPKGETSFKAAKDGLSYSAELVQLLKSRHSQFCCGVAGFPETHPDADSPDSDIMYLEEKLDAGGDFVTTQLFFENKLYYDYVFRCNAMDINVPILPGLLPATSLKQIKRITSLCQASFPESLAEKLKEAGDDARAGTLVGIDWTADQISDLLSKNVPGVHLYVLNRAKVALAPAVKNCFAR